MFPVYEEKKENLHLHSRIARHESPHLHNSVEFIYLTEGCLELGMGQKLFHMDAGFESQRTFNRAFRERYKMTPREYRNLYREKFILQNEII